MDRAFEDTPLSYPLMVLTPFVTLAPLHLWNVPMWCFRRIRRTFFPLFRFSILTSHSKWGYIYKNQQIDEVIKYSLCSYSFEYMLKDKEVFFFFRFKVDAQ